MLSSAPLSRHLLLLLAPLYQYRSGWDDLLQEGTAGSPIWKLLGSDDKSLMTLSTLPLALHLLHPHLPKGSLRHGGMA